MINGQVLRSKFLPDSTWLFVGLVESDNSTILDEIARKIVDKDLCYACCIGTFGEKLHDLIDENLVIRESEIEKLHLPKQLYIFPNVANKARKTHSTELSNLDLILYF